MFSFRQPLDGQCDAAGIVAGCRDALIDDSLAQRREKASVLVLIIAPFEILLVGGSICEVYIVVVVVAF